MVCEIQCFLVMFVLIRFSNSVICHSKIGLLTDCLHPWSRDLSVKPSGTSTRQAIPRILWYPKIHYCIYNRPPPPPLPVLSQSNAVRAPNSLLEGPFLILFSHLRLRLPSRFFPSDLLTKTALHLSCLPHVLHSLPISFFLISSSE